MVSNDSAGKAARQATVEVLRVAGEPDGLFVRVAPGPCTLRERRKS